MQHQMMADERFQVTMPRFDSDTSNRTVSIITQAVSDNSDAVLEVEVVMDFDFSSKTFPTSVGGRAGKRF